MILQYIKGFAEDYFKEKVEKVKDTVPATLTMHNVKQQRCW